MNDNPKTLSILTALTLTLTGVFVTLKLTGNLDWSWVWVLSPLWVDVASTVLVLMLLRLGRGSLAVSGAVPGYFARRRKMEAIFEEGVSPVEESPSSANPWWS